MNQCPYCKNGIDSSDNRCVRCGKWLIGLNRINEFLWEKLDAAQSLVGLFNKIYARDDSTPMGIATLDQIDSLVSICIEKLDGYSPSQQANEYYHEFLLLFQDYREFAKYARLALLISDKNQYPQLVESSAKASKCLASVNSRLATLSKMRSHLEASDKGKKVSKRISVKHKPTGQLYEFNLDNPPQAGIEKIFFTVAINKQDAVLKQSHGELYVKLDDL